MEARSNIDAQAEQPAPIMPPVNDPGLLDRDGHPLPEAQDFSPAPQHDVPVVDEGQLRAREELLAERERQFERMQPRAVNSGALTEKEVESQIVSEFAVCAYRAYADQPNITPEVERALKCTTLYVMVLRNGFPIIGSSVCAAPENYDVTEGRKEARAEAMAKLWLAEEYAHQNRLMGIDYVPPVERAA